MYFKDCTIVKSHKLGEVVRKHFAAIDFMGDLKGPGSDIFQENSPSFHKRKDGLLNS